MSLEHLQTISGHSDRVWTLAWNPKGTLLASSGADKIIRLWAKNDGQWICSSILSETHSKTIRRICWSPCGQYLASASFDASVNIWRRNPSDGSWSSVVNLEGHENEVKSVAWSHDGRYLASCGRDKTVWIWERSELQDADEDDEVLDGAENWDCSDVKNDHTKDVKHVVWHPNQNILVSCSYDDSVKLFHLLDTDWKCFETLNGHTSTVWSADFSATGKFLVTGSDDKSVRVWKNHAHEKLPHVEQGSWKCISTIQGYHSRPIYDVSWCGQCDIIVSASGDNSLVFYKESTEPSDEGNFICINRITDAHRCDINSVAWNPTEKGLLASGGDDNSIKIWKYSDSISGTKILPIADEMVNKLISRYAGSQLKGETNSDIHVTITDHLTLSNIVRDIQLLQDSLNQDKEIPLLEEIIRHKIDDKNLKPVPISNPQADEAEGLLIGFKVPVVDITGNAKYIFHIAIDKSKFKLSLPKRTSKLFSQDNELLLIEKAGDIFKILPSGTSQFQLGHLFALSDVKLILGPIGTKGGYVISADRDEKIRISNYPKTHIIERFCFGHEHFIRRLIVVDEKKFLSIDQKENVCLWSLDKLKSLKDDDIFKPELTETLNRINKRLKVC